MPEGLIGPLDLTGESWREYEWIVKGTVRQIYRILDPVALYYRVGGATHRIVDTEGVAHCIPAPGQMGCILRWYSPEQKVSF